MAGELLRSNFGKDVIFEVFIILRMLYFSHLNKKPLVVFTKNDSEFSLIRFHFPFIRSNAFGNLAFFMLNLYT